MAKQENENFTLVSTAGAGKSRYRFSLPRKPELLPEGTCDFCGAPCGSNIPGCKLYECGDFVQSLTNVQSVGAWAGCPDCASLIDAEAWSNLEMRMHWKQIERYDPERRAGKETWARLERLISDSVRLFRRHRKAE
jgi:hypothetical protein